MVGKPLASRPCLRRTRQPLGDAARWQMQVREHEVVIVGGGPTGLMLAGELALAGVDVAIVERRSDQGAFRFACGRIACAFARSCWISAGSSTGSSRVGQTHPKVGFYIPLDISDFPTRHNYLLALRQERIERLLADWIEELNVPVYRGVEVLECRSRRRWLSRSRRAPARTCAPDGWWVAMAAAARSANRPASIFRVGRLRRAG